MLKGKVARSPRSSPVPWGPLSVWVLVPILVLLVVWEQVSVDRLVVSLERERDARTQLESQVNALRMEADRLSSLGQVEARAEEELGLVRPSTAQIVDLVFAGEAVRPKGLRLRPLVGEAQAATRTESGRP